MSIILSYIEKHSNPLTLNVKLTFTETFNEIVLRLNKLYTDSPDVTSTPYSPTTPPLCLVPIRIL